LQDTVNVTDYVIDILLIHAIVRQVRPHQLTPRSAAAAQPAYRHGIIYLRAVQLGGKDPLVQLALLPPATERMTFGTGIASTG
jgi:hypothetical protein